MVHGLVTLLSFQIDESGFLRFVEAPYETASTTSRRPTFKLYFLRVCAKSDAATDFSAFVERGSRRIFDASFATRGEVCLVFRDISFPFSPTKPPRTQ